MALYRDLQFNKGTVTDLMGAVGTVTGATFNKDKKGWALQTGTSKYVQYDRQLLPNSAYTVVAWAKIKDSVIVGTHQSNILGFNSIGTRGFCLTHYDFSGKPCCYIGSNNYRSFIWTPDKKWHCFIFTITGHGINDIDNAACYIDNILRAANVVTKSQAPNLQSEFIYSGGSNTAFGGSNISRIKVYDHVLTSKEREKEQIEFEAAQPLTYQKRQLQLPKPTELKQQGLVAAYNMKPVGNILHDISGNGNNGTNFNCLTTANGIKYNGVNSYSQLTTVFNFSEGKSIALRIDLFKVGLGGLPNYFLGGDDGYGIRYNGTTLLFFNGGSTSPASINLIKPTTPVNFIFTRTTSTNVNIYLNGLLFGNVTIQAGNYNIKFIGKTSVGNFANVFIEDLKFYNKELSTQEIKAYHNSFNEVILHEKFENMAVGSSKLPNGWIKNGGSFVCGENTTNDTVIKSIRKGTKYLKCVTAGIVAIPCKQAYGSWKFGIYYTGTGSQFNFISSTISGLTSYNIYLSITGRVQIRKETANLAYTDVGYITNNNYYEFAVERLNNGDIYLYIQGGIYTSKRLVSMTNGSGTNPTNNTTYTASNYIGFVTGGINDRISNILIQSQIKV